MVQVAERITVGKISRKLEISEQTSFRWEKEIQRADARSRIVS